MSSKDFLDKMRASGEAHSADSEFINVAKMIIKFGYSGFLAGHRPSEFFKPFGSQEDADRVAAEVSARLKEMGSKREAVFAIFFNIPSDTNTSTLVDWSIEQITFADQKEKSEYNLFFASLNEGSFPINEWFWGSYKNVPTGEYEKDGEKKKRYLSLPVEKFVNEAAARQTVGNSGGDSQASDDSKWSDLARATFEDNMSTLEASIGEIRNWYKQVADGKKMTGYDLPIPLTPVTVKKQIADAYTIETSDVDIVLAETPF